MLRVVFMGSPDFAVPTLEAVARTQTVLAVYSQPDQPVGRGQQVRETPVKKKAKELGIEVRTPAKLNTEENLLSLRELKPDVLVVVAYGKILRQAFLSIPTLGSLNVHASLLPRWRGAAPIQHAILEGDSETGATIMKMVEELDAGPLLSQIRIPILAEDTAGTLHNRLAIAGAKVMEVYLQELDQTRQLHPEEQSKAGVTYATKLSKAMEGLDSKCSADVLERRVRALHPWPGTSLTIENLGRLRVHSARVHPGARVKQGQLGVEGDALVFGASGDSVLELLSIQLEGKKVQSPIDFINGCRGKGWTFPLQEESQA